MIMLDESDKDFSSLGFKTTELNFGAFLLSLDVDNNNNKHFKEGKYRIINCPNLHNGGKKYWNFITEQITQILLEYLKKYNIKPKSTVLVCGIGNEKITSDSLGPKVLDKVFCSRLFDNKLGLGKVCGICPMVQSQTGIETYDQIVGVSKQIKPKLIVLVDSLLTQNVSRLAHSFQITDTGLIPGGAMGKTKAINIKNLNIPCFCIGVPLMVDLKTIAGYKKSVVVSPKDILEFTERCSNIIANAINKVFNSTLSCEEILELKNTI